MLRTLIRAGNPTGRLLIATVAGLTIAGIAATWAAADASTSTWSARQAIAQGTLVDPSGTAVSDAFIAAAVQDEPTAPEPALITFTVDGRQIQCASDDLAGGYQQQALLGASLIGTLPCVYLDTFEPAGTAEVDLVWTTQGGDPVQPFTAPSVVPPHGATIYRYRLATASGTVTYDRTTYTFVQSATAASWIEEIRFSGFAN